MINNENEKNSSKKHCKHKRKNNNKNIPIVQYKKEYSICIEILNENELMTEKELKSLAHQIKFLYSINKKSVFPVNLCLSNYFYIKKYLNIWHEKWDMSFYTDEIKNNYENIIYLSADAEEVLTDVDKDKIYVIGGLIDRNRHKGLVYNYCKTKNIRCVKLPIKEFVDINSSTVLTTNQVFEILHDYFIFNDWKKAFEENIPKRKIK